jgi:diacylglycerol O-acyltransferase / wax synthase
VQRMTSLERLFLGLEQSRYPLDGAGILLLDPSTAGPDFGFERVRRELEQKLDDLPLFTRRAVEVPFNLAPGSWVDDPAFDLDHHVHRIAVPSPGGLAELTELTIVLTDRALDRSRPLWRLWYVEGVEGGRVALILRIHHALIDGMGGVEMFARLFATAPEPGASPPAPPAGPAVAPERVPSGVELLVRSAPELFVGPVRALRDLVSVLVASRRGRVAGAGAERGRLSGRAPRMLFNRSVTSPDKRLGLISLPLDEVKTVKDAFGTTVHDVVLAIVAGSVRDYLLGHDELPGEPLSVLCPMNMRTGAEDDPAGGNYFALVWSRLPTHLGDAADRLRAVHADMTVNKRVARARGSVVNPAAAITDMPPSNVWPVFGALMTKTPFGQVVPPITNLVVSNIAGPPFPLYFAGARLEHIFGRTMLMAGVALFVHCISYDGRLEFGVTALSELVPDPQRITDGFRTRLDELLEVAAAATT